MALTQQLPCWLCVCPEARDRQVGSLSPLYIKALTDPAAQHFSQTGEPLEFTCLCPQLGSQALAVTLLFTWVLFSSFVCFCISSQGFSL